MFVSAHGNALALFQRAIQKKDAERAVGAAREMAATGGFDPRNALELIFLFARTGDERFEPAARRWVVGRGEAGLPLVELQLASAAFAGLLHEATYRRCELVLRDLITWIE